MTRARYSVIVYGEEFTLPASASEPFGEFERLLEAALATLEARWQLPIPAGSIQSEVRIAPSLRWV